MFADKAALFNHLIQRTCTLVDHQLDVPPRRSMQTRLRRVCSDVGQSPHSSPLSSMRDRRCDSQHIIEEEEDSLYLELGSHMSLNDESRPVFVVAEEELG